MQVAGVRRSSCLGFEVAVQIEATIQEERVSALPWSEVQSSASSKFSKFQCSEDLSANELNVKANELLDGRP